MDRLVGLANHFNVPEQAGEQLVQVMDYSL
jgi:hypothetical protein